MQADRSDSLEKVAFAVTLVIAVLALLLVSVEQFRTVAFLAILACLGVLLYALNRLRRVAEIRFVQHKRTQRRAVRALSAAEQSRHSFDALVEGLRVFLFVIDEKGYIVQANKAAQKAFDSPNAAGLSLLAVTQSTELEELVALTRESTTRLRHEITLHHPAQSTVRVYSWNNPAVPGQVFVTMTDVTELRLLERVRKDFVANVSHELRTPMTTIRAMAETLQEGGPEEEALRHGYLEKIIREVDRLTALTNDLLTLSEVENARPLDKPFNMSEVVERVVEQLSEKAKNKGLTLKASCAASAPVLGSGSEMTQVVLNLLDNAINYTSTGSIDVKLEIQGDNAVLRIADTGVGIAEDQQKRIFERFYRVDKGRSRASGGTGLGLSIVRHIVEAHEGTIKVESELNKGSTFVVTVPLHR
ncbi:MAG TPA: ATP-binding protein [Fimbriimonadaceae bacterium]|nr:ATP-binding protein [Fimbriimonadaceae bacterium]